MWGQVGLVLCSVRSTVGATGPHNWLLGPGPSRTAVRVWKVTGKRCVFVAGNRLQLEVLFHSSRRCCKHPPTCLVQPGPPPLGGCSVSAPSSFPCCQLASRLIRGRFCKRPPSTSPGFAVSQLRKLSSKHPCLPPLGLCSFLGRAAALNAPCELICWEKRFSKHLCASLPRCVSAAVTFSRKEEELSRRLFLVTFYLEWGILHTMSKQSPRCGAYWPDAFPRKSNYHTETRERDTERQRETKETELCLSPGRFSYNNIKTQRETERHQGGPLPLSFSLNTKRGKGTKGDPFP